VDNVIQYFNNTFASSLKFSQCISVFQYHSISVYQCFSRSVCQQCVENTKFENLFTFK